MEHSTAVLWFFVRRIHAYEPGILRMIEDILNIYFKNYGELTMPQIRNSLMLQDMGFTYRFCVSTAKYFDSIKIAEILKLIKNPRECIYFSKYDNNLLNTSPRQDIANYIHTNMLLAKKNKDFSKEISFYDFTKLSFEKIKNAFRLIKNDFKQPYVKWYVQENDTSKIKTIIKLKKAGYSDLWCAEPIRHHFTSFQIDKMIQVRKNENYNDLDDEKLYWMVKNYHY